MCPEFSLYLSVLIDNVLMLHNLNVLHYTYHGQETRGNVAKAEAFISKMTPVDAANASPVPLHRQTKKETNIQNQRELRI